MLMTSQWVLQLQLSFRTWSSKVMKLDSVIGIVLFLERFVLKHFVVVARPTNNSHWSQQLRLLVESAPNTIRVNNSEL